ncbi:hypothetical protein CHS0354_038540 [Potamilus streckersoni]|uniref:Uncharacterized protein n=1 Tax=Potamilus streckersoni TaxID=2493646 RepID=A0AAE0RRX2_9BIVA|nr:hypothetical protein CHS0354_038540 [Potamilus streckersoni]
MFWWHYHYHSKENLVMIQRLSKTSIHLDMRQEDMLRYIVVDGSNVAMAYFRYVMPLIDNETFIWSCPCISIYLNVCKIEDADVGTQQVLRIKVDISSTLELNLQTQ